ncbi:MAG: thiophene and furan oxidation protein ThdF, partial [Prevotella sp.]|nr:thiophene and furan oxidation protein ThdF [Prevotella sp.]
NMPSDLIAEDLRLVLSDLAEITGGEITTTETLSNIFSHFCVGK